jgi:hypothetical protein
MRILLLDISCACWTQHWNKQCTNALTMLEKGMGLHQTSSDTQVMILLEKFLPFKKERIEQMCDNLLS